MHKTPANLWIRLLADQVDSMLFLLPHTFYFSILATSLSIPQLFSGVFFYLITIFFPLTLISFFYKPLMTHYFGGSLGKLLTGLNVTNLEYKRLSFKRAFFRYSTGYAFSGMLFGLGFFAILKDTDRMGWHDKAVGSRVIKINNFWPLSLFVLILAVVANFIFLASAINTLVKSPLPGQFSQLFNIYQEPKVIPDDTLQESFLYPPNTHIGVIQQNN